MRYEVFTNAHHAGHNDVWGWIKDNVTDKNVTYWGKSQTLKTKDQADRYVEILNSCGNIGDHCGSCQFTEICITSIFT